MEEQKVIENKEEIKTEVTSIAKEEIKNSTNIKTPSQEELVARASVSLISNLRQLEKILISPKNISKRGIVRAVIAGLNLPTGGLPVKLQSHGEKLVFGTIQRIIADRFLITQHHIAKEMKIIKKLKEMQEEQKKVIEQKKIEGATEEEIKQLEEKHRESLMTMDKLLRGEEIELKNEISQKDLIEKGEKNE